MNISEPFIRRPIATSLIMLGLGVFGALAYRGLAVSDLPNVDFPTLNVSASLPGADPATMASAVASPLERQFTGIAGLAEMTSVSTAGGTNVTLQFDLDRDIDHAAVDVQTAIAAVMPLLPAGLPAPPSFRKFNPADQPVIYIGLVSNTMPMSTLDGYAENVIAPRYSTVTGVSQVQVFGSQKFAVRVQVDPDRLLAQRIGLNEIDQALRDWNVNLPTGELFGRSATYNLKVSGQLPTAADFRPLVVAYRRGAPVRLGQVARVLDSVEDTKNIAWLYTKHDVQREVYLSVMRQPGANTIEVSNGIRALFPLFERALPPSVHMSARTDRSKNIREAFVDIQITMGITLVLVVLVIFVFLASPSATLIPSLALPFSILGTFAVMKTLGYTLDNLSMMALILSIGFVVDDAIVMLENIVRHVEAGTPPRQAALDGSGEIGFTILTMTTSLAAVFIPILFMGGILGRLFREFAVTITTAILISGVVSVTLTPMLCSRLLRAGGLRRSRAGALSERVYARLVRWYAVSLASVLRHRLAMLVLFLVIPVATAYMFVKVPKGFIPDQDNDAANVTIRAAQGTSFDEVVSDLKQVADIVIRHPYVEDFFMTTGGNAGAMNTGRLSIVLTPRRQRPMSATRIAEQLRGQLARFPGFRTFVTLPPALQIGGRLGTSSYSLVVQSANTAELYRAAASLEAAMAALPQLQEVADDMEMKSPRLDLQLDRDKAAVVGLNAADVQTALYDAFGQKWASTIYGPAAQYRVLLEVRPDDQAHPAALRKIAFKTPSGALVPLESIVRLRETVGPQTVNHAGQLPAVTISFGLRPGVSLGEATAAIGALAATLPPTVTLGFQGSAKVFQASMQNLGLLLFVAIGVVYIVLGMLYESYTHPITILSGLPSAGLGALVTLWAFGNELNIYSFVGLVMLVGIVKKNAIMQIDFALDVERRRGLPPAEAIHEGCLIRFRPILMTTMAALLGAIPIACGFGAGGEARRPLGLALVGGLFVSQFITLYLTPVVYTYLAAVARIGRVGVRARARTPGLVAP
ncbi:MAG TPA: efflux RND transporter permease subunit [Vicinamibacterales bacterium]|nr:efflux RND transporter permease subunit [Vicinamibacterales bacterium]